MAEAVFEFEVGDVVKVPGKKGDYVILQHLETESGRGYRVRNTYASPLESAMALREDRIGKLIRKGEQT